MKTSVSGIQKRQLCICFTAIGLFTLSLMFMLWRNEMSFFVKEPYYYIIRSCIMALPFAFLGIGSIYAVFGGKQIHINVRWIPFILILLQAGLTFLGMYAGEMWDHRPGFTGFGLSDHYSIPYWYEVRPFYQNVCLGIAVFQVLFSIFVIPSASRRWVIRSYSIAMALVYVILFCTEAYTQSVATYSPSIGQDLRVFRPSILFYLASNAFLQLSLFDFGEYLQESNKFLLSMRDFVIWGDDECEEDDDEKDIDSQYIILPTDMHYIYAFAFLFGKNDLLDKLGVLADIAQGHLMGIAPQCLTDDGLISIGEALLEAVININSITEDLIGDSTISLIRNIISEDSTSLIRRISVVHLASDLLQTNRCFQQAATILYNSMDIDFV